MVKDDQMSFSIDPEMPRDNKEATLPFSLDEVANPAKIAVVGVGGAGGNAINRMVEGGVTQVKFIAINTDAQDLGRSLAHCKVHIGQQITGGRGAGAKPTVGRESAIENEEDIIEQFTSLDMVFVTAGLGGGTGTGAAPQVARMAKESGALTVAVVTLPFAQEGKERRKNAASGLDEIRRNVDATIIIANDKLKELSDKPLGIGAGFRLADEVLTNAVRGIADLITKSGIINVDFADVRTIMENTGLALMGTGTAKGEERALHAVNKAISSPLSAGHMEGRFTKALVNITTKSSQEDSEATLDEMEIILDIIRKSMGLDKDENENIICGIFFDENLREGELKVTVTATGIPKDAFITQEVFETSSPIVSEPEIQALVINDEKKANPILVHDELCTEDLEEFEPQEAPKTISRTKYGIVDEMDQPAIQRRKKADSELETPEY